MAANLHSTAFSDDTRVLELDSGDGCTRLVNMKPCALKWRIL